MNYTNSSYELRIRNSYLVTKYLKISGYSDKPCKRPTFIVTFGWCREKLRDFWKNCDFE